MSKNNDIGIWGQKAEVHDDSDAEDDVEELKSGRDRDSDKNSDTRSDKGNDSDDDKKDDSDKESVKSDSDKESVKSDSDKESKKDDSDKESVKSDSDKESVKSESDKESEKDDSDKESVKSDSDKESVKSDSDKESEKDDSDKESLKSDSDKESVKSDSDKESEKDDSDKESVKSDSDKESVKSDSDDDKKYDHDEENDYGEEELEEVEQTTKDVKLSQSFEKKAAKPKYLASTVDAKMKKASRSMVVAKDAKEVSDMHIEGFVPPYTDENVDLEDLSTDALKRVAAEERANRQEVQELLNELRNTVDGRLKTADVSLLALKTEFEGFKAKTVRGQQPTEKELQETNSQLVSELEEAHEKLLKYENIIANQGEGGGADEEGLPPSDWRKRYEIARQRKRTADSARFAMEQQLKKTEIERERYRSESMEMKRFLEESRSQMEKALTEQAAHLQKAAANLLLEQAGYKDGEADAEAREMVETPIQRKLEDWKREEERRWEARDLHLVRKQLETEKGMTQRLDRRVKELTLMINTETNDRVKIEEELQEAKQLVHQVKARRTYDQRIIAKHEQEIKRLDQATRHFQNELDIAQREAKVLEEELSKSKHEVGAQKRYADSLESTFKDGATAREVAEMQRALQAQVRDTKTAESQVKALEEKVHKEFKLRQEAESKWRLERRNLPEVAKAAEMRKKADSYVQEKLVLATKGQLKLAPAPGRPKSQLAMSKNALKAGALPSLRARSMTPNGLKR